MRVTPYEARLSASAGRIVPPSSPEYANVARVPFDQEIAEVTVELHVTPLVGGDSYRLGVFLNSCLNNVDGRTVVSRDGSLRPLMPGGCAGRC